MILRYQAGAHADVGEGAADTVADTGNENVACRATFSRDRLPCFIRRYAVKQVIQESMSWARGLLVMRSGLA